MKRSGSCDRDERSCPPRTNRSPDAQRAGRTGPSLTSRSARCRSRWTGGLSARSRCTRMWANSCASAGSSSLWWRPARPRSSWSNTGRTKSLCGTPLRSGCSATPPSRRWGRTSMTSSRTTPEMHAEATAWTEGSMGHGVVPSDRRRTRKDGSLVDVEILAIREEQEVEPSGFYILYHDVTELEQTRRQLEDTHRRPDGRARAHRRARRSCRRRSPSACSKASCPTDESRSNAAASRCCSPTWSGSPTWRRAWNPRSSPRC